MSSPPTKYIKSYDYAATPPLNVDFDRVKVTTDQTIDRLALIQRDDGGLKDGLITTASLADKSVTEPKLADLSVSTRTLQDLSVTTAKLALLAVGTAQLGLLAVGTAQLADLSVTQGKLSLLSVGTPQLIDAAVTSPKLGPSLAFTGLPTAPTPNTGDNTTRLATTAFVAASMSAAGMITEAPNDGKLYGRFALGWQRGVALAGDTMTGLLLLSADPAAALGAATKQYVDAAALALSTGKVAIAGDTMTGPLLGTAATFSGNGQFAKLGIGMVPVNVLDITQNQNGMATIGLLNNNGGAAASARLFFDNGTSTVTIRHASNGMPFVAGSGDRANSLLLQTNGKGGMVFGVPDNTGAPLTHAAYSWFMSSNEKMRMWPTGGVSIGDFFAYGLDPGGTGRLNQTSQVGNPSIIVYLAGVPAPTSNAIISAGNASGIVTNDNQTGTNQPVRFFNPNGNIGTIQISGSATAYLTSSDGRLKNWDVPQRDFRNLIKKIELRDGEFISGPGKRRLMFSAQQVYEAGFTEGIAPPPVRTPDQLESDESNGIKQTDHWMAELGAFSPLALWGVKDLYGLIDELKARLAAGGL